MDDLATGESGYLASSMQEYGLEPYFTDVEVIRVSAYNVVARGKRYGRWWLLKGLPSGKGDSEGLRRRLNKEFEIHSRLRHPSIPMAVTIEDVEGLGPCMVMEWVEGENLGEALDGRIFSQRERREILQKIVEVVAYIHASGISHRDLKPSNIMLRKSGGEIALIDFGLADTDYYAEMKQPAGTPGFISPEQREKGGTDTADDVFSIGVLIRLLCPGYRRLAKKCTAPKDIRPADAGEVLRILKRRRLRHKNLFLASLGLLCAGLVGTVLIATSNTGLSDADRERMSSLMAENREIKEKSAHLEDSLRMLSGRLADSESRQIESARKQEEAEIRVREIEDYEALKQNIRRRGMEQVNVMMARMEGKIARLDAGDHERYNKDYANLNLEYDKWQKSFSAEVEKSSLSSEDKKLMTNELTNYYFIELDKYVKKCLKKLYPQH